MDSEREIVARWDYWLEFCWRPESIGGLGGTLARPAVKEHCESIVFADMVERCMNILKTVSPYQYRLVFLLYLTGMCKDDCGLYDLGRRMPRECPADWRPAEGCSDEDWARLEHHRALLRLDRIRQGLHVRPSSETIAEDTGKVRPHLAQPESPA